MIRSLELRQGEVEAARPRLFTPAFVTVTLASLAYFTAEGVLLPALPRYVEGPLGGGDVAVGLVVGAFSLSAFFLRPWAGGLGDRRGRRLLMVVGAAVFAISVLGYLVARSPLTLAALRLLTGAGDALFFVGVFTAATDLAPPNRHGEAMSYFSLSIYVGIGIGPLLSEAAIDVIGFPGAWLLAALGAAIAITLSTRMPDTRPEPSVGSAARRRLIHRAGLLPGLVMLTSIWGMAGFLTFVPLYALDLGMSGSWLVLGLFSAVVVLVRSLGARIPDRLGAGRATRLALAASTLGLLSAGLWHSPAGLVVGTAVFGLGIALFTPALMTLAVDGVPPTERGAVIGTTSAFLDLAFGLGPATLGFVAAGVGREGTFVTGAGVALAGLAIVVGSRLGQAQSRAR
ncbi:MAG: MFS transporter [Actinomycetota bacterium]